MLRCSKLDAPYPPVALSSWEKNLILPKAEQSGYPGWDNSRGRSSKQIGPSKLRASHFSEFGPEQALGWRQYNKFWLEHLKVAFGQRWDGHIETQVPVCPGFDVKYTRRRVGDYLFKTFLS